jgi:hypothetical protein
VPLRFCSLIFNSLIWSRILPKLELGIIFLFHVSSTISFSRQVPFLG